MWSNGFRKKSRHWRVGKSCGKNQVAMLRVVLKNRSAIVGTLIKISLIFSYSA